MEIFHDKVNTNFKVCIVEDDPMIQEIYQTALETEGYKVIQAFDGEEGLALIKKEMPDIALVDIMMNKKDGICLIKDLQKDPQLVAIPVIIITNRSDEKTMEEAGKLNTKFYLEKSLFKPKDIVEYVKEALYGKMPRS